MTPKFFKDQMARLAEDFGAHEYTKSRAELIWNDCKDLPDSSFAKIIKHFLYTRSIKYPPLPTHFHEAAIEQRKALREGFQLPRPEETLDGLQGSEEALSKILKKLGAKSLVDAISKSKKLGA